VLRRLVYLVLLVCALTKVEAQTFLTFVDAGDNKPLGSVAVYFKCAQSKCDFNTGLFYSDENGKVILPVNHDFSVEARLVGYATQKFQANANKNKLIALTPNNSDLNEVVITGQYEATSSQQSVQKIRTIDSKRIMAQGAVNLRDLLSNELNVRISQDNMLGSSLSLQGISGQNIKILINGVPLIGRMNGNIDLNQINLNNIERIEIIEGPMSVAYGTDALGGVVNLITKRKKSTEFGAGIYSESTGQFNANTNVSLANEKHRLNISAGRNFFRGYTSDAFYQSNIKPYIQNDIYTPTYKRKQQWLPKTQWFTDAAYTYSTKNADITYQTSYFNEFLINKGVPVITNYSAYALDDYFRTKRFNNCIFIDYKFKNKANLNLINSASLFSRDKNTYRKDLVSLAQTEVPNTEDQSHITFMAYNFRGTYSTQQHKNVNYQIGYDINYESSSGDRLKTGAQITDAATFLSTDCKPNARFHIRPSLRTSINSRYASPLIPAINIRYAINSSTTMRASYGKGFRAPSLKELDLYFFDFNHAIQGNSELKAEKSDNINLIMTYRSVTPKIVFMIEPSIFFNQINNMISLTVVNPNATPPLYTYLNIDKYKTQGISLQSELKIQHISINAGVNYTGRYNLYYSQNTSLDEFLYSPEFRTNINYTFKKPKILLSAFYKYTGTMPGFTSDAANKIIQTQISDYNTLDITAGITLFNSLVLQSGVKNIFNVTNINSTASGGVHGSGGSLPVFWGRSVFASVTYNFKPENK